MHTLFILPSLSLFLWVQIPSVIVQFCCSCLIIPQETYLKARSEARKEQGTENTDFGELRSPFQLQMLARIKALEISDA